MNDYRTTERAWRSVNECNQKTSKSIVEQD
ncbi:hypothetical protein GvMRE_I1g418 [endosymbiont GvMRE of Glomus versiforme]|nr:hypothetical protein GvMRE_I1g418 [endosymbiont GvMRE of Glomus versiforme]